MVAGDELVDVTTTRRSRREIRAHVPEPTERGWKPDHHAPSAEGQRQPTIPFVGLAEALVLESPKLYSGGGELLFDYVEHHPGFGRSPTGA